MSVQPKKLLCRYQYDPLDRVVDCAPVGDDNSQHFYRKNRLATEIRGRVKYSIFAHETQLLAQQQQEASQVGCALLATDLQGSVFHFVAVDQHQQPVYSPYGHRSPENGLVSLLAFNGERRDLVTGHYLLGHGYRAFNPVLMRFNSPDRLSPFGKGGISAYAYCLGDPINMVDPLGRFGLIARGITHLTSAPSSAFQQMTKGFSALKKGIVSSFKKRPTEFSVTESGMKDLLRTNPERHGQLLSEVAVNLGEANVRNAGAEYRNARNNFNTLQKEFAPLQRLANSNGLGDKFLSEQPLTKRYLQSAADLQRADQHFSAVTTAHILKNPGELRSTHSLVELIRTA